MLNLKREIAGITVSLLLYEGFNLIRDDSGIGKTYLFKLLYSYYSSNKLLNAALIDSSNYDMFIHSNVSYDLLILDNSDLYLTDDLLSACLKRCKYVLCSSKRYIRVPEFVTHVCTFTSTSNGMEVLSDDVHLRG